jgi:DNA-binding CsgD family transcriptional regulator
MLATMKDKPVEVALPSSGATVDHRDADGERHENASNAQAAVKLKLSHTPIEHQLYQFMLAEVTAANTRVCAFSLRQFMALTRLPNYSAIRRGLNGLVSKQSIERYKVVDGGDARRGTTVYFVFTPEEILERRANTSHAGALRSELFNQAAGASGAIDRVVWHNGLSRREAQVALCCAEGLTNSEIGKRLYISEQTVKFHLRHVFVKYGVKRRAELISRLLSQIHGPMANVE